MANERARELRKSVTAPEVRLWVRLRALRSQGVHFRRQVPRAGYIVDFACLKAGLAIEVDGEQHGFPAERVRDSVRDQILARSGLRVLRFWNAEIRSNIDDVVQTIVDYARRRLEGSD